MSNTALVCFAHKFHSPCCAEQTSRVDFLLQGQLRLARQASRAISLSSYRNISLSQRDKAVVYRYSELRD